MRADGFLHEKEATARACKAFAIARFITVNLRLDLIPEGKDFSTMIPQDQKEAICRTAGVNTASPDTWALVDLFLRDERRRSQKGR